MNSSKGGKRTRNARANEEVSMAWCTGSIARAKLLLVFVLVPLLFLVLAMLVVVIGGLVAVFGRLQRLALPGFAFGGLALAHSPVVFPGIEQEMQPRHHLFDRR